MYFYVMYITTYVVRHQIQSSYHVNQLPEFLYRFKQPYKFIFKNMYIYQKSTNSKYGFLNTKSFRNFN